MSLNNDVQKLWTGWLVDDLGGREESYQTTLVTALKARNIPKSSVKTGVVNMWWRKDSRCIDIVSELDGYLVCTIHIQEYGASLWIGRAVEPHNQSNYYKRMAASAFIETIDRCIRETTLTLVDATAIHDVEDMGKQK